MEASPNVRPLGAVDCPTVGRCGKTALAGRQTGACRRAGLDYRVLGPLEVRDGERSLPLAGAKQRALLALLLVNANHVVSRDRLIDQLWGEQPPDTAVTSLQVYVSRLRKLLPAETLLTRPPG